MTNTFYISYNGEDFYLMEASTREEAEIEILDNDEFEEFVYIGEQGEKIKLMVDIEDVIETVIEQSDDPETIRNLFTPKQQDIDVLKDNIQKTFEQWQLDTNNDFFGYKIVNIQKFYL